MFEHIAVRRKPGSVINGIMSTGNSHFTCSLGRTGASVLKRESDGATPAHRVLRARYGYWRKDRLAQRPPTNLPLFAISERSGWCDEPAHPAYNQPVNLPFAASHEKMMRTDCLYDLCIVLDWNMVPGRARFRGSAIFLHVAKQGYLPTEGCIALALPDLLHVVSQVDRQTHFTIFKQT